jgi:flagellar biosynthesis protein FlhB
MSSEEDQSQKTETPTQKKLDDAHKKGEVPKSMEVNHWFMIVGGTMVIMVFSGGMLDGMRVTLSYFLQSAHTVPVNSRGLIDVMELALTELLAVLWLPLTLLAGFAIAANLVQHKPVFTAERMKPKFSKISVFKGAKRLFSMRALVDFAKGIGKLAIVATVAAWLVFPERDRLDQVMTLDFIEVLHLMQALALRILMGVVVIMAFIAGADLMYQRFQHTKRQRMSKKDIRDELKQSEGDPLVRARIRQIRSDRARRRMMAAVPTADVVITNPTHYSVALKYDDDDMNAPVVVAKGVDAVAHRIREVAKENDIPLVENPPVARALYATVDLDQEIDAEHYQAVAEIIGFVLNLKRQRRPGNRSQAAGDGR